MTTASELITNELLANIHALTPPERLRLAADLMEERRGDVALPIISGVARDVHGSTCGHIHIAAVCGPCGFALPLVFDTAAKTWGGMLDFLGAIGWSVTTIGAEVNGLRCPTCVAKYGATAPLAGVTDEADEPAGLVCIQRTLSPRARKALTAKVDRIR